MAMARDLRLRRKRRVRLGIRKKGGGRPRLAVFRSARNIYAQIVDDAAGVTLAAASSLEDPVRASRSDGDKKAAAAAVGRLLAERAKDKGVGPVVFDRGAYLYHGRVKALAEAAREGGLDF